MIAPKRKRRNQPSRNAFRGRDVSRTIKFAKLGGIDIGTVEVVTKDGTTIRVVGKGTEAPKAGELDDWMAKRASQT
jgi:hypothetical protein